MNVVPAWLVVRSIQSSGVGWESAKAFDWAAAPRDLVISAVSIQAKVVTPASSTTALLIRAGTRLVQWRRITARTTKHATASASRIAGWSQCHALLAIVTTP